MFTCQCKYNYQKFSKLVLPRVINQAAVVVTTVFSTKITLYNWVFILLLLKCVVFGLGGYTQFDKNFSFFNFIYSEAAAVKKGVL